MTLTNGLPTIYQKLWRDTNACEICPRRRTSGRAVMEGYEGLQSSGARLPTMKTLKDDNKEAHQGEDAGEKTGSETTEEPVSDKTGFFTPNEKIDFTGVKIEPLFADFVDFDTFSKSDFRAVKVKECSAVPKSKKLLKFVLDDGTGTDRVILSGIHAYYEPEELVGKTLIAITNLPPRAMMGIDSCGMLLSAVNERNGEEELHLLMVDNHIPAGAKLY